MADKVDDGCNRTENGSSQNQASSSCKPRRRASQGAERAWETLGHRKAPRGDPGAGASTRWSSSSNAKKHCRRTSSTIRDSARKDLESLAVHMPNLPDTDARTLALRMFYIEVSNGMSAGDAEINVSQMFMVSPITVRRWVTLWKNTREEAFAGRGFKIQRTGVEGGGGGLAVFLPS